MKTLYLLLVGIALGPCGASAMECKPVRLDGVGRSMEKIPVMDQDGKPICYSYSAAAMADAWRFSHGDRDYSHLTSPVAAAVYYANQFAEQRLEAEQELEKATGQDIRYAGDFDYGWVNDTLASITSKGSCDYQKINAKFGQIEQQAYFEKMDKYFSDFELLSQRRELGDQQRVAYAQKLQCSMYEGSGGLPVPKVTDLVTALTQPNYLKFLEKIIDPVCQDNLKALTFLPKANVLWARDLSIGERNLKLTEQVTSQFATENPQPMSINFCGDVFYDPTVKGVDASGELDANRCSVHHIALIIGQRPTQSGGCEFLVRNSQGESCYGFPEWEDKCEKGQYWMSSEEIVPNVMGLTWLPQGGAPLKQER